MKTQTIHSCFQIRIFITIIADPANNQPLAMKYNNTLYYYVLNAQGDVVRIVNSSRSVVASYTYDPWGKIISSSGTLADINPLRYRGYYYDTETGFYYLQSRYYDPEIGRFINADSYASTDATGLLSTNMFAYCENDPVNRSDPSGEFWNIVVGAALGAITLAVSPFLPAWLGAEESLRRDGSLYFAIVCAPMPFRAAVILFGAALRASGDTRTPMEDSSNAQPSTSL